MSPNKLDPYLLLLRAVTLYIQPIFIIFGLLQAYINFDGRLLPRIVCIYV